jgi:hypothetical protein
MMISLRRKCFLPDSKTDTKGETIFEEVRIYFKENNIPVIACATDGG